VFPPPQACRTPERWKIHQPHDRAFLHRQQRTTPAHKPLREYRFDQHGQPPTWLFLSADHMHFGQADKQLTNTRMVELHRDSDEQGDLDISKLAESLCRARDTFRTSNPAHFRRAEFPTSEGKLHLAAIRDLFHRGIVGWATSPHPDSNVAVEAFTMAAIRTGHPSTVIHHSDKGSAYTSLHFAVTTGNSDVRLSFGSTGDAYDNAAMETVWARLKVEIAWIRGSIHFQTRTEAHDYLFEFIEVFYNRQRHQARLDHLTPTEYLNRWRQRQQP
jgi:transposase InsO family protein